MGSRMKFKGRILSFVHVLATCSVWSSTASLVGCNAYTSIDTPSGDAQILSAARACFDQGNFQCASNFYGQLSSASSDQSNSEQAFLLLAQNGATSAVFLNAVLSGTGSGGKLVTKVAESLSSSNSTTQTARLAYLHAYQKTAQISDTKVKGLVQFITSLSLLAELVGESAGKPGLLKQTDLVTNPANCNPPTALDGCARPGAKLPVGSTAIDSLLKATDDQFSGDASLQMINATVIALDEGVNNLKTSGDLGSSTSTFTQNIINNGQTLLNTADGSGYRGLLIQQGIGE